jgi:D-glycero-alpha-D-manno-heptose-7-phosphate kinase
MADIPAGNGLASSSAFTVGLIKTVHGVLGKEITAHRLALEAVRVELDLLGEPIGLQDQFASAYGGLNFFYFQKSRNVMVRPLNQSQVQFPFDLVLVKVGAENRNASFFTKEQHNYALANPDSIKDLIKLRDLAFEAAEQVEKDMSKLAAYTRAGWELKLRTNPSAQSEAISESLAIAMGAGAEAGKLVGAGGSGFLLLLVDPDQTETLIASLQARGQKTFKVELDHLGSQVVEHE